MEIVGAYATRVGSLVEVGVRRGPVGPLRRHDGFQVVERDHVGGRRRGREAEQARTWEEARHLAEARLIERGGLFGSANGVVCAPLEREASRALLAGRERYLHVGAARQRGR